MNDESQLIAEALAGRSAAFSELVSRYQDRLYTTMVHVVGSTSDAEDVVQEAFVTAFVKLGSFRQSSKFYTWLYRIAFNLAMSHGRRRRPAASIDVARETIGSDPVDEGPAPAARLEAAERGEQVRAALAMLSDEHRAILILREVDGCDYENIAEVLDLPIGTVRSRLFRARMQLRDQLKEVLHEDG